MTQISAGAVKDLRNKSGAGMMDCKKALAETGGDIEAAVDWLRKKGLAAAQKKSARVAAEGVVAIATRDNEGGMIELNAETDFVSRNEQFQALARDIALAAIPHKGDVEQMNAHKLSGGDTLTQSVTNSIAQIGENITFSRATYLSVDNGVIASYVHSALSEGMGRIGILLALRWTGAAGDSTKLAELGKRLAMHIAAAKPDYVHRDEIPQEVADRERAVLSEQALASGKPAEVVSKMVEGRMKRFFSEVCLLDQIFVIDNETLISDLVKKQATEVGGDFEITAFSRFILGENVEKQESDFSAEVASMVKG